MLQILKLPRREPKKMVGWNDELVIRPDTPLTPAQKKQLAKAIKRAKRNGKIAASAQQTIPYEEMYQNGVCSLGNRLYSKSVAFEDCSYAEASDDDKAVIFELYCRLVNYFGPSVAFELSVVCYYPDMAEYRKILRIPPGGAASGPGALPGTGQPKLSESDGFRFIHRCRGIAYAHAGRFPAFSM